MQRQFDRSALAGIISTARLQSAQPTAGVGFYELDVIAAVVVGGTSLAGESAAAPAR